MAFTGRSARLERDLRRLIARVTDEEARALTIAWADAWDEIAPELTALLADMMVAGERITRTEMLRSARMLKVLEAIADALDDLSDLTGEVVTGRLREVIDLSGSAQASIIDSQLPPRAPQLVDLDAWSRIDPRQVQAIVRRSTQQITSRRKPLSGQAYDAVRKELVRGISVGASPKVTARRIIRRAEKGFNGGLARALTIARTETLDAHREAARVGQMQHADVLEGWQWVASLTPRTCPACFSMHGTIHALEEPGPIGHPNCRCARVPITRPWRDLGFDIEEPPSVVPDADGYFAGLDKVDQLTILGSRGYDAWKAGQWPREAWAVRRQTPGWRDSMVVARAPEVTGANGSTVVPRPKEVPGAWTGPGAPTPGQVTRAKGVRLEPHERVTSYRLASLGDDVHWLPNPDDSRTVDLVFRGQQWEAKAPTGSTGRTIRNRLSDAHDQGATRAVLDLYRTALRNDLDAVRRATDSYWGDITARGATSRIEQILVLTENVEDHFTLEYGTWLSQR